jgi:hypothetical protein
MESVRTCGVFKDLPESQLKSFTAQPDELMKTEVPLGEKTARQMNRVWSCKVFKYAPESKAQSSTA